MTRTSAPPTLAIVLRRLPKIQNAPGLIQLRVEAASGGEPPTMVGVITEAALRGRLAQHDLHSANELAAVRHALASDCGEAIVYESWPNLESCLQFWHGFAPSRIRLVAWTCEACGLTSRENLGGSVGESIPRLCGCGRSTRVTIPKTV